jgi:hypothetical protein
MVGGPLAWGREDSNLRLGFFATAKVLHLTNTMEVAMAITDRVARDRDNDGVAPPSAGGQLDRGVAMERVKTLSWTKDGESA